MRLPDIRFEAVLGERPRNPRHEIVTIGRVADMLELTTAALGKVAAWRHLVVRAGLDGAVVKQDIARDGERDMLPAFADALAARGDADDRFRH